MQLHVINTVHDLIVRETSADNDTLTLIKAHSSSVTAFVHDGAPGMAKRHENPLEGLPVSTSQSAFLGKGDDIATCPVTGDPVDKKISATFKRKEVFFCRASCVAIVQKVPERYLK